MILADRGFLIEEDVALQGARLVIPALTKGKQQLSKCEVELSRQMARDPMLGFPTPPQGSSPNSHFTASPLILSNMAMFQSPHPMTPLTPDQEALNNEEMKEIVEASPMTALPPSPEGTSLPPCKFSWEELRSCDYLRCDHDIIAMVVPYT